MTFGYHGCFLGLCSSPNSSITTVSSLSDSLQESRSGKFCFQSRVLLALFGQIVILWQVLILEENVASTV